MEYAQLTKEQLALMERLQEQASAEAGRALVLVAYAGENR